MLRAGILLAFLITHRPAGLVRPPEIGAKLAEQFHDPQEVRQYSLGQIERLCFDLGAVERDRPPYVPWLSYMRTRYQGENRSHGARNTP